VGARLAAAAGFAVAALLLAGCGSSGHSAKSTQSTTAKPEAGSVAALLARPGPNINVVPGTEDFAPGPVRFSFLLVNNQGAVLTRPGVRVWVATSNDARPFATATASIEPVGVPGADVDGGDVTQLYVAHFAVPKAGTYTLGFEAPGKKPAQASTTIKVRSTPQAPAVGSQAIASDTPTIASTRGNFRLLTTRTPPDKGLLQYSVAGSLAAHKPFVVVFATPKFCTSRTCGPVVDVVDAVRKQLASTGVRFIHVEVYKNNNPGLGYNQWFKQWHLPTEPWTFLVGADGKIKQRFEGSVSPGELAAAVKQYLT
jgi:hypothetical protein